MTTTNTTPDTTPARLRLPHIERHLTPAGLATYHVASGTTPCWCDLARDHTEAELAAWYRSGAE